MLHVKVRKKTICARGNLEVLTKEDFERICPSLCSLKVINLDLEICLEGRTYIYYSELFVVLKNELWFTII